MGVTRGGPLGVTAHLPASTFLATSPHPCPQVNLDFESEKDMIEKFRVGLALQPIANALFASSPFKEGKPSGWVWNKCGRTAERIGRAEHLWFSQSTPHTYPHLCEPGT